MVQHYGTRAYCWDVVNEALDDHGLKPSAPWYPALPNYIDVAFVAARKAAIAAEVSQLTKNNRSPHSTDAISHRAIQRDSRSSSSTTTTRPRP